ncbi:carbohydrate ABC transporter permease [Celeribacter sp.]|uniref:carbohydrate ABC transporter permease n=1 Tax=Celeribacter sp. TaxID=1890673 RepID=UPI003A8F4B52
MHPALQGLMTIVVGVGACVSYFYASNLLIDKVLFPPRNVSVQQAKTKRLIAFALVILIILGIVLLGLKPFPLYSLQSWGGYTSLSMTLFVSAVFLLGVHFLFPKVEQSAGNNINRANIIRPWLFLFPALFVLTVYLAYPVFETLRLSLTDRAQDGAFVGLDNYRQLVSEPKFWEAIRNNMLWLIVVPAMSTIFGLIVAQLTDRIKWGNIAKSIIFMPMAISFVGASVIWKLVYDARPPGTEQIGVLNAVYMYLTGNDPQQWLTIPLWNNFFLMAVLIWIQTGFAMVILSAALRGIPEETIEAAIIDGAGPFQIFFKIKVPQMMGTIMVVWTTITITVLKVFDIVYAMTNGQWETQVLANYMYDKLFRANDWGVGSAAAMVIMLLVTPILVWNVVNARREMR